MTYKKRGFSMKEMKENTSYHAMKALVVELLLTLCICLGDCGS